MNIRYFFLFTLLLNFSAISAGGNSSKSSSTQQALPTLSLTLDKDAQEFTYKSIFDPLIVFKVVDTNPNAGSTTFLPRPSKAPTVLKLKQLDDTTFAQENNENNKFTIITDPHSNKLNYLQQIAFHLYKVKGSDNTYNDFFGNLHSVTTQDDSPQLVLMTHPDAKTFSAIVNRRSVYFIKRLVSDNGQVNFEQIGE